MRDPTSAVFGLLTRRTALLALAIVFILLNALMFPLMLRLRALSGTMIPDMMHGHDAAQLSAVVAAYGAEGLDAYRRIALYDVVYPASYALLFAAIVFALWSRSAVRHLAWLPVLAALIDWVENRNLGRIVEGLPSIDPALASMTGRLVTAKMALIAVTLVAIATGVIRRRRPEARERG